MTLILSGTDGLSDVDGTAAAPAIRGTDANTGIFFPAADTIAFSEGGAEAMRIDSDGDVGIGTSSPSYKLHVVKGASDNAVVIDNGGGAGDNANPYLAFSGTSGGSNFIRGRIRAAFPSATEGGLVFDTGASGSMSERMRIDTNGYLLVNQTSNATSSYVQIKGAQPALSVESTSTGGVSQVIIRNPNGTVGSISTSGSSTAYNTSSDYRLKNTISPMIGALAKVALLKPSTYKWIVDGSNGEGFIAHELAEVFPNAVNGEKDAVETYTDEDGNESTRPVYQGVDTSFLVATLTAAIQEQQALITALTARITALENT